MNWIWKAGVALAGAGLMATAASAQSARFVGSFTLPCDARWGSATLPAGDYTLRVDSVSKNSAIRIASVSGDTRVYVPQWATGGKSTEENVIFLTVIGHRCVVRSLNLADLDVEITYERLTREEREEFLGQSIKPERRVALVMGNH